MSQITEAFRLNALRTGVIVRPARNYETAEHLRYAASVEMLNLGFKVLPADLEGMSSSALTKMINDARVVIGANRDMRPIYPGFPKQVQDLDTLTLLMEQILHYWTGGTFLPNHPEVLREGLPLADMLRNTRELRVLSAGGAALHVIEKLTLSGVAMSDAERALLAEAVKLHTPSEEEIVNLLRQANNGENAQAFALALNGKGAISANTALALLVPVAKNADHLLRYVLAFASTPVEGRESDYERAVENLSDRDASAVRMVTLSRPVRRAILTHLERVTEGYRADALIARRELWRRVMRMIHPYSVIEAGSAAARPVDIIHGNIEHRTLNSHVEAAMAAGDAGTVVELLGAYQPGNLLRRMVAILRITTKVKDARKLAEAVRTHGVRSTVTTLVSAYNGLLAVNDTHARVTRVAGRNNFMLESDRAPVNTRYVNIVSEAVLDALRSVLASKAAPTAPVGVTSEQAMPLVRRDLATTDRVMDRGETMKVMGQGDTLRVFSHWVNTSSHGGYMDLGVIALDSEFNVLAVSTWNSWNLHRSWTTYSGDKHVSPRHSAAEYYDVDMDALQAAYPDATWVAVTIWSYSSIPFADVDMIAGAMLRSEANAGEVFDPRTVTTAFIPTTDALQSVPLAVNVKTREMVWLDSSSGSMEALASATGDTSVGSILYDEIARPRLTMGEVAMLWAEAHNMDTVDAPVDRDAILSLLN